MTDRAPSRRRPPLLMLRACRLAAAVLLAGPLTGIGHAADSPGIVLRFSAAGLASLTWHGHEYLASGTVGVTWNDRIELRDGLGTVSGVELAKSPSQVQAEGDAAGGTVRRTYEWGGISTRYAVAGDRLRIELTIENGSAATVTQAQLQVLELALPGQAAEYDGSSPLLATGIDTPALVTLTHPQGVLVVSDDEGERPLSLGFPWANDRPASTRFPLWADSGRRAQLPTSHPAPERPIPPGGRDRYRLSLRFGAPGSDPLALAGDVVDAFRARHPATLAWADRRPLGMLILSSTVPHHPTNPRGWLNNVADIDTTTDAGRADFATRLGAFADQSIARLRAMGAQGCIIWDLEGQEFPHAVSYLGDPRCLPPEMAPLADGLFKRFADAGLAVGVTIRPQRALVPPYGGAGEQLDVAAGDLEGVLADKIGYAAKRWGCTLFYVDSDVVGAYGTTVPIPADTFRRLAARFPEALLIPEQEASAHWACTAPYNEVRGGWTGTPALARRLYPRAFSVLCVSDGDLARHHDALLAAVRAGDVLLFRSWFDDPANAVVTGLMRDAGRP